MFWHDEMVIQFDSRPNDSPVMVSLACGSLSGIASSTGNCGFMNFDLFLLIADLVSYQNFEMNLQFESN